MLDGITDDKLKEMMATPMPTTQEIIVFISMYTLFGLIVPWLYFALQFASKKQGTLGMRAVGIKVVDHDYKRISFANATGRYFGMILSAFILYIGYIMIAFVKRKQGLHDLLASTYIIYD